MKMEDMHTLDLFSYGRSNQQRWAQFITIIAILMWRRIWIHYGFSRCQQRHGQRFYSSFFLYYIYFKKIYCLIWKKNSCTIYFEKIYCLIWRKFIVEYILRNYTVRFDKNLLPNIFWENILFDLKKISCPLYFEKIYCLIWRKFIVEYVLRKYTIWFKENLLSNMFWENILFDLKKIYCRIYF